MRRLHEEGRLSAALHPMRTRQACASSSLASHPPSRLILPRISSSLACASPLASTRLQPREPLGEDGRGVAARHLRVAAWSVSSRVCRGASDARTQRAAGGAGCSGWGAARVYLVREAHNVPLEELLQGQRGMA
jgi:hypothetical protein